MFLLAFQIYICFYNHQYSRLFVISSQINNEIFRFFARRYWLTKKSTISFVSDRFQKFKTWKRWKTFHYVLKNIQKDPQCLIGALVLDFFHLFPLNNSEKSILMLNRYIY